MATPQETQYVGWSTSIYGPDGLQRFWKGAELFVYNPNDSLANNLLNLSTIAGMFVPVFDAGNAVVYMIRGDQVNAALSGLAIIPFVGDGKLGVKMFRKVYYLAGCINCFTAGTKVTTIEGDKSIEEIRVGDLVLSKNPESGETGYKRVEQLFEREITETWNIHSGNEIITTTGEHPFWIVNKGWVITRDLQIGDQFETEDGADVFVDRINVLQENKKVYNFSVEDFHSYYISNLGILAHNTACLTVADYIAKNISQYTTRLTSVTSGNILAKELVARGILKPVVDTIDNFAAHHIIALTIKNGNPFIRDAQAILARYNIDLNSAANGVWLPMRKGESAIEIDGTFISTHNGYHTGDYFEYVFNKLDLAKNSKAEVLLAIESIRSDLLTGIIKLGNVGN